MAKLKVVLSALLLIVAGRNAYAQTPALPEQMLSAPSTSCSDASFSNWPGLTLHDGIVTGAAILGEIDGYAKNANTTGGLGGKLVVVTTTADYDSSAGEKSIPGSLRMIVEKATHANTPIWIVFSPSLGRPAAITLDSALHIGNNVTIDGTCSDLTIQGLSRTGLLYLIGSHNVVIDRLQFRKTNYISGVLNADLGTAIRLRGNFDGVAILHNELSECGDGCIDTTSARGDPVPTQSRVTVAFNYIHDHNKAMLLGTYDCHDGDNCTPEEAARNAALGPGLFMTMEGNALIRTAQRNPRTFGRAMLHSFDNYIAFQPHTRPNGPPSGSYGIFVSNGARALIEHNWLIPLDTSKHYAIYTSGTIGTKTPSGDKVGFIRLEGGPQAPRGATVGDSDPQKVPDPPYAYHAIPLETLPPDQALACVATRAGRNGASSWNSPACSSAGG